MDLLKKEAQLELKEALAEKGVKQKYLANNVGVSSSYLGQVLAGKRKLTIELALKTAKALEVPIEKILNLS